MSRQSDAVSSPLHNDSGGRRRADSAGQHNCLASQSFHSRGVSLIDGHFSQGQTEETGGDTRIERRKEGRKEGSEEKKEGGSGESWKTKKEKIEGWKGMKESLYALLLVLLLVVTKASIKIAHNLASEVHQGEKTERKPAVAHKWPVQHEK